MMNYQTWKSETTRGITTPRSSQLKAVDQAFERAGNLSAAGLPAKKAVFDALAAWIKAQRAKGQDWKRSTRNSNRDATGKGTVERLLAVFQADPYFRPQVAQLNGFAPAPPAVPATNAYAPGRWDRVQDVDGRWHEYIRQHQGMSCVPATIVMVKRAVHSLTAAQLNEEQIRGVMALEERGLLNAGISSLDDRVQAVHDWEAQGTGPARAVAVLRATPHAIRSAREVTSSGAAMLAELNRCSPSRPGLIGWLWQRNDGLPGGGHFTVCAGPVAGGAQLLIIDPHEGLQYIDNDAAAFTTYRPRDGLVGNLGCAIVCD